MANDGWQSFFGQQHSNKFGFLAIETVDNRTMSKLVKLTALLGWALLISGCLSSGGSGDGSDATAAPPPTGNNNQPPVISGQPGAEAMAGDNYEFTPTASDADGDSLTFSIQNKPSWMTFNSTTGTLAGQPGLDNEGTYENIQISVSDGTASASLQAFAVTVVTVGNKAVTLNWTPPTQNNDGSYLNNLAGYRIYYGIAEGQYSEEVQINNAGLSSYTIDGLLSYTYYFVATSVNSEGVESAYSNVVAKDPS